MHPGHTGRGWKYHAAEKCQSTHVSIYSPCNMLLTPAAKPRLPSKIRLWKWKQDVSVSQGYFPEWEETITPKRATWIKTGPRLSFQTCQEAWIWAFLKWTKKSGEQKFFKLPSIPQPIRVFFQCRTQLALAHALPLTLSVNYDYEPLVSSWPKRRKSTNVGEEHAGQPKLSHAAGGVANWHSHWEWPQAPPVTQQCHSWVIT